MSPIQRCAIKFGALILSGPMEEGHAGVIRQINSGEPWWREEWERARKDGAVFQGFLQENGRFVDRPAARIIAIAAGQVAEADLPDPHIIFSEDFIMAKKEEPSK